MPDADTGRMVAGLLASSSELGTAEPAEPHPSAAELVQQLADHIVKKSGGGRGGGGFLKDMIKYGIAVAVAAVSAYIGIRLAIQQQAADLDRLADEQATHQAAPGHSGTRVELDTVKGQVHAVERKVDGLGVQIDEKAAAQREQLDDIKEELRYLRRHR